MNKIALISMTLAISTSLLASNYSLRKYQHVKSFYRDLTPVAIEVTQKHKLPTAAILAIAGLESGYGSGYVSQITGNILSLGAFKSDAQLPALYIPYSKSLKRVLFDSEEIKKYSKTDLSYKKRPKSYKRDYRPAPYAATTSNLGILKHNKELRFKAHEACLNDFATRWIVLDSNIKSFRNSRAYLNEAVAKNGIDILNSMNLNITFVNKIGGVKNSFNYRKTWPKKVVFIMKRVGLVQLIDDIKNKNMSFEEAWENK